MTLIRKNVDLARSTSAAFFDADGHSAPDARDLDFYLFDREARMDEVRGSRAATVSKGTNEIEARFDSGGVFACAILLPNQHRCRKSVANWRRNRGSVSS